MPSETAKLEAPPDASIETPPPEQRIHSLMGKLRYACGAPADFVMVAVVADGPTPNLLGAGFVNEIFSISFSSVALDEGEAGAPSVPSLYLVVSVLNAAEDGLVPVYRHDVDASHVASRSPDLGTIVLPLRKGAPPSRVPGLVPAPGGDSARKRLRLDDVLVQSASWLTAMIVEEHTGWAKLSEAVRFEVVDDFVEPLRRRVGAVLGRASFDARETQLLAHAGRSFDAFAFWDPASSVVYLNRPELEQQNLNFLYCTIGHELVHVGQSKRHPELDALQSAECARYFSLFLAEQPIGGDARAAMFGIMANIEGYAQYIETSFLSRYFTSSLQLERRAPLVPTTLAPRRTHTELDAAEASTAPPSLRGSLMTKAAQYDAGRRIYQARSRDGKAARFDPSLRPEPFLSPARLAELTTRALGGCAQSRTSLGDVYRFGLGVAVDRPKARRWYRLAVEAGSADAGRRLREIE